MQCNTNGGYVIRVHILHRFELIAAFSIPLHANRYSLRAGYNTQRNICTRLIDNQ